jgi:hypothetical protein
MDAIPVKFRDIDLIRTNQDRNDPTGFVLSVGNPVDIGGNAITVAITDATRTVAVNSTTSFHIYSEGRRFTKAAGSSVTFADTEGTWYIYFDSAGVLQSTQTFSSSLIIGPWVFVCELYWDASNKASILGGIRETHGIQMDGASHYNQHFGVGAIVRSGLSPSSIASEQDGSLDAHAQWGVDNGSILDEDQIHSISAVASTSGGPILYLSTASLLLRETSNAGFWIATAGSGRVAYNNLTTGALVECDNNRYVWVYIAAIGANTSTKRVFAMPGVEQYANISAAELAVADGFYSLLGKINLQERRPLFAVLLQTNDSYANAVKARVRATSFGDYVDFRSDRSASGMVGMAVNHNALSGRSDPGAHPTLDAGAGNDQIVKMGDAAGANKVNFVDSADAVVASIDSDGVVSAPSLKATASGGGALLSSNGTSCLTWGAGAGANVSTADGLTVAGQLAVNTIAERTAASGVTIDGLLVKDGGLTAGSGSTIAAQVLTATTITGSGVLTVTNATEATSSAGSIRTSGGISVAKGGYFGGSVACNGKTSILNSELSISSSTMGNTHFNFVNGGINYITRLETEGTYFRAFNGTTHINEAQFTSSGLTIFTATEATSSAGSIRTAGGISAAKGGYFGGSVACQGLYAQEVTLTVSSTDSVGWYEVTNVALNSAVLDIQIYAEYDARISDINVSFLSNSFGNVPGISGFCKTYSSGVISAIRVGNSGGSNAKIQFYLAYIPSSTGSIRIRLMPTGRTLVQPVTSLTPASTPSVLQPQVATTRSGPIGLDATFAGETRADSIAISGKITGPTPLPASFADLAAVRTFLATLIA